MTRRVLAALLCLVAVFLAIHGWHWLIIHLAQETGTSNGASRAYDFWSGFGSDLGEATLIVGVAAAYRHHNCHVKGCPRLGRAVDGTPYIACPKHHPDHAGVKRAISHEDLLGAHASSQGSPDRFPGPTTTGTTTANAQTFLVTDFTVTTPKEQHMPLLDDIERRFTTEADRVVTDAEKVAKSKIGQVLLAAGKEILPLLPEGREASLIVTKLEEAEAWAHRALQSSAVTLAPADPAGGPGNAVADADSSVPGAVEQTTAAAAPPAPLPADPTAAAPADSSTAAVPVAATGGDASTAQAAPATAEADAASPAAEDQTLTVPPPFLFTTSLAPDAVDLTSWPLSIYTTPSGEQLYSWAGEVPAPADGTSWIAYAGPVIPKA